MAIQAILFDMYGTLVSTGTGSVDATRNILDFLGIKADAAAFYAEWKQMQHEKTDNLNSFITQEEIFETTLDAMFRKYGINAEAKDCIHLMLATLGNRTAFPETREVLDALSGQYQLVIGSTSDTEPLMSDVKRNGLKVDRIFTSESMEVYKPQKRFFSTILSQIRLEPKDVVYVGDSPYDDVYGPQQLGIYSILVDRKKTYDASSGVRPDQVIASLTELSAALDNR